MEKIDAEFESKYLLDGETKTVTDIFSRHVIPTLKQVFENHFWQPIYNFMNGCIKNLFRNDRSERKEDIFSRIAVCISRANR